MIAVRVVQVAVDEVIDVITVRHRFVTATGAVDVSGFVAAAGVLRRADIRVGGGHLKNVIVHMVPVGMVQMAVVQVIHMAVVDNGGVAAAGAMLMVVRADVGVGACAHGKTP